jgi:hypothetical protein
MSVEDSPLMRWDVTELGFRMGLSPQVPRVPARHVREVVEDLLAANRLGVEDVRGWAVHPGGPVILDVTEKHLGLSTADLAESRAVFAEHGNCSSSTVLLVLDLIRRRDDLHDGDAIVAMAFGPGLTLYATLLRFSRARPRIHPELTTGAVNGLRNRSCPARRPHRRRDHGRPVYMQKAIGLPVKQNIFRTWGNHLLGVPGGTGYVAGFLFHQGIAVFAAVLYALFFQAIGAEGRLWLWGLVGGLVHYLVAGPVVGQDPVAGSRHGRRRRPGLRLQELRSARRRDVLHGPPDLRRVHRHLLWLLHSAGGLAAAF